jgi:ankyrin repeat protein
MVSMLAYGCGNPSKKLADAISSGDGAMVKKLIKNNPSLTKMPLENWTSLTLAAYNGRSEIVRLLLDAGADMEAKDQVAGETPLHWAAIKGHKDIAEMILSKGAQVDSRDKWGLTPLQRAAEKGQRVVASILIDHKADINATSGGAWDLERHRTEIKATDTGWTPLLWAAAKGNWDVAELLIAKGADVNTVGKDGKTALYYASKHKTDKIIALLREHGAKE